ncbi:MAG: SDR family NAD(P)-dependent oxidoreductase [Candidatus Chisholmbacteria bacterium]|nr:SDR family NAD(P)-dependent oxidoreductase [Candidatus Chisholmbacteria bacterium]
MSLHKRVLVTGASGFVGANLARVLFRKNFTVFLLLRPSYNPWRIQDIKRDVAIRLADLADERQVTAVVRQIKPDWVFHLATYGAYPHQDDEAQMIETNIKGTLNLARACIKAGVKVMMNTSSSSEYGFKADRPTENQLPTPNSDYAATKAAATLWCRYLAEKHRLYIPTLRLYSVYGPFEEPTRLMPRLMLNILQGRWPPLVDPLIARDFIYVDDVCEAMVRVTRRRAKEWGPIYNVGSGTQTRLKQLVALTRRLFKVKQAPVWATMKARRWDTNIWRANPSKIRRDYHWQPEYTLEQGLQRMGRWLQEPQWQKFYAQD